jgi:hypothetical protein
MPSTGWPTEPSFVAPGRLVVTMHEVSLMPHTSQMGMPRAAKNSSASTGIGAAPVASQRASSRPRRSLSCSGATAAAPEASSAAFSFSHTRGTPPKTVGLTCATTAKTCVGSATGVTVCP